MNKFFSKLLNLTGEENNGTVTFSDGTVYTRDEIVVLKKAKETDDDIKKIHWLKSTFGGDLEFYGKSSTQTKKQLFPEGEQLSLFEN